ncbi:MAG: phage head closure protein [Phycisphaerales bacterium]
MAIRSGKLDKKLIIQQNTPTTKPSGDLEPVWSTWKTVWGELLEQSGGESFQSDRRVATQKAVFKIRFLKGLSPKHQISWRSQVFEISDVAEPKRGSEMVVTCYSFDVVGGG